jgi:hypothetical protein
MLDRRAMTGRRRKCKPRPFPVNHARALADIEQALREIAEQPPISQSERYRRSRLAYFAKAEKENHD